MSEPPDDSSSLWKLICHLADAMSWKMVCALGFISFLFFYGAANATLKLFFRELSRFETQPGPIIGLGAAGLVVIAVTLIKRRPRP
jgi:cytosine/uracil/thiamine/allantoin permease